MADLMRLSGVDDVNVGLRETAGLKDREAMNEELRDRDSVHEVSRRRMASSYMHRLVSSDRDSSSTSGGPIAGASVGHRRAGRNFVFNAIAVLSFFSVIAVVVVALSKTGSDPAAGQSALNSPIALPSSFTLGIADTSLGRIVVDSDGFTLYLFKKDSSTSSACNSVCTIVWQPLRANGEIRLGPGLAADVGSVQRSNGDMQVTYGGHPLYLYAGDDQPGDVNGEGINAYGALWYAVSPSGTNIPTPKCGPFCGYGYAASVSTGPYRLRYST
jgi:predicted lipoprotein with Yx(FWY)xxD motif